MHTGLAWGLVGVVAFSFTVPFTRIAVGGLSPLFIGSGRAVLAGTLAIITLTITRQPWPTRRQWHRLGIVAGGVVLGFPLLTSIALTTALASHGAVVIAMLPAATAVMAVLRGHEHPARSFWVFASLGTVSAIAFASLQNGGLGTLHWSDALLFGAVIAAAVGYAEGGLLARELGSWQTVSWALVLAAPVMTTLMAASVVHEMPSATASQWLAFGYLALVSMFLGFFAWYRGLAIGPIAQVSQTQLAQPVMTILWAALLLREPLTWPTVLGGIVVIGCAALAVRTRLGLTRASSVGIDIPTPAGAADSVSASVGAVETTTLRMYTTTWCGYCQRLKAQLGREGIAFTEVDIELNPDAAARVREVNGGNETVPTVEFADGTALTNPSIGQVKAKLGL